MSTATYIPVEAPISVAPTIATREPRILYKLSNPVDFLNHFVINENIRVYSEVQVIGEKNITNRKGEVTTLPATASYQLRRGFLNLTDTGSIYYKNNGKTASVGYVKVDQSSGDFEFVVKNDDLLEAIA